MRHIIIAIMSILVDVGCLSAGSPERLAVEIDVTPAATDVPTGTVVALVPRLKGGGLGETKYTWSVDGAPPVVAACQKGLKVTDKPVTEFQAPPSCKGNVTIGLTLRRGEQQAETHRVLRIGDPEPPAPVVPVKKLAVTKPTAASFPVSLDRAAPFQVGGATAAFRDSGDTLSVTLALEKLGYGFGGVCLPLPNKPVNLADYRALEFEVALREGARQPLQVKIEQTDSGCPVCQCYLHNKPADELLRVANHKVRLPLEPCGAILQEVARICFAMDAEQWESPGHLKLDVRDLRFVR